MSKTFSVNHFKHAIDQYIEYAQIEFGKSQSGYFSKGGWAGDCLTFLKSELDVYTIIFKLVIKLIGKLSANDISRLIGESDAKILDKWYFENRSKYT